MRHVIVGAGPAGVVAAETLRALDPAASIVLVNGEPAPPYARMALPYLISGAIDEKGAHLRSTPGFFDDLGVELIQDRATGVSISDGRLELAKGAADKLAFDRLLVATGMRPKAPDFQGLDVDGLSYCWTLGDVRQIMDRCKRDARVVVLGAGFVACIIMKALISRGVELTIVTGSSGQMVRSMLCPQAGELLRQWCEHQGVSVVSGEKVSAVERGPVVTLGSGTKLEADAVIVAMGVEANVDFLEGSGAIVEQGVLVDEHFKATLSSGEGTIFAAGDVAQGRSFGVEQPRAHPIHPVAVEHGRLAALNMCDHTAAYHGGLQMNVLDAAGLPSFSFGRWNGSGVLEEVEAEDVRRYRFIKLCFDGEQLVGANAVGFDRDIGAIRGLIQTQAPLGRWKEKLMENPFRFSEAFVACTQR